MILIVLRYIRVINNEIGDASLFRWRFACKKTVHLFLIKLLELTTGHCTYYSYCDTKLGSWLSLIALNLASPPRILSKVYVTPTTVTGPSCCKNRFRLPGFITTRMGWVIFSVKSLVNSGSCKAFNLMNEKVMPRSIFDINYCLTVWNTLVTAELSALSLLM